ncbi:hypothetical protein Cgig2_002252 [Carnegiea gigantea]|uniref:NAD-dependent epimerase/dehydratase domain-containing protein n=1 Tax=Carnegiea gigantea TaxID=171969 RepID=A0A9Q1KUS8_9CARY|nr:hypothetical protein Cgig2_002252 [Carnegiea gigantea]
MSMLNFIVVAIKHTERDRERERGDERKGGWRGGKVVCVTGASGFIASWLVQLMLQRGYFANGIVPDLGNALGVSLPRSLTRCVCLFSRILLTHDWTQIDNLRVLGGAKERLHLFEEDLMVEGSFDSAIFGCDGIFRTASPVNADVKVPHVNIFVQLKRTLKAMAIIISPQWRIESPCDFLFCILQFHGDVLDPATKGTFNVLSSCKKCPSVKRAVLTSSMATVMYTGRSQTPDVVIDEDWFSDSELCKK